jgi:hypothetical protein
VTQNPINSLSHKRQELTIIKELSIKQKKNWIMDVDYLGVYCHLAGLVNTRFTDFWVCFAPDFTAVQDQDGQRTYVCTLCRGRPTRYPRVHINSDGHRRREALRQAMIPRLANTYAEMNLNNARFSSETMRDDSSTRASYGALDGERSPPEMSTIRDDSSTMASYGALDQEGAGPGMSHAQHTKPTISLDWNQLRAHTDMYRSPGEHAEVHLNWNQMRAEDLGFGHIDTNQESAEEFQIDWDQGYHS